MPTMVMVMRETFDNPMAESCSEMLGSLPQPDAMSVIGEFLETRSKIKGKRRNSKLVCRLVADLTEGQIKDLLKEIAHQYDLETIDDFIKN